MWTRSAFHLLIFAIAVTTLVTAPATLTAQSPAVKVGAADIGGVVTSAHGPEAGVWVIALTDDLPTRYAKIVVTDDKGRYLIPDLPRDAGYTVWSRGYGLVDGPKVHVTPGKLVNLRAVLAPSASAAAQYYPAEYWYSLLNIPPASDFPGTGPSGNGIGVLIRSQNQWLEEVKTDGCITCHQLGNKYTRTIPKSFGPFPNGAAAWTRRTESGLAGPFMATTVGMLGPRSVQEWGAWTDSIAKGAIPFAQPPRPQGIERDIVITEWDWAAPTVYLHDEISTDKRNPRLNAYGKIYGSPEESSDYMPVLDPVHNSTSWVHVPYRDADTPTTGVGAAAAPIKPSNFWGMTRPWLSHDSMHNPMLDEQGRVWLTSRIRANPTPAYCRAGSTLEAAQVFPMLSSSREASVYDPRTGQFMLADLCFSTHHLYFDRNDNLWFTAGGGKQDVVGWLDTKKFLQTGDAAASQGWTPLIVDTLGTGKRTATWTDPGAPLDPTKDARISGDTYGAGISPVDGSYWGSVLGYPGKLIHVIPGPDPSRTALTEAFELPAEDTSVPMQGFSPRGMDIDSNGVVWAPLASGHLASFDRRKCKGPLTGPKAPSGKLCPEGWTLYPLPGPQFKNLAQSGSAEASYFTYVDRFNTLGLGKDVPMATGNLGESVDALVNGKFVVMRVPYPLGFFAKNVDGRIDNPNIGWKGRGMWTTFGSRTPFHMETGKGTKPIVLHVQIRPNPLAD